MFVDLKDRSMNDVNLVCLGLLMVGLVATGIVSWFTLRRITDEAQRFSAYRWLATFGLSISTFMSISPLLVQSQTWLLLLPFAGTWLSLDSLHRIGQNAADQNPKLVSVESETV